MILDVIVEDKKKRLPEHKKNISEIKMRELAEKYKGKKHGFYQALSKSMENRSERVLITEQEAAFRILRQPFLLILTLSRSVRERQSRFYKDFWRIK